MESHIEQYLGLLHQKLSLHEEIENITLKLYAIIEQENFSGLTAPLHQRDARTYAIIAINKQLEELKEDQDFSSIDKVRQIQDEIVEIRKKIVYHDNRIKKRMLEKREEYRDSLREINMNRKVSRSYNLWDYKRISSFFDKRQ